MQNVFLIGGMKCATNTLYHALRSHPVVATPERKELDYFVKPGRDRPYAAHFDITSTTELTLDGTTQYSKYPQFRHIPEMIRSMNPNARIIYLVRDPLNRYESNIAHHIAREEGATIDDWRSTKKSETALDYGRYYTQIAPYVHVFGRDNVFLGFFEELVTHQNKFLEAVCDFLRLEFSGISAEKSHYNPRRGANGADSFQLTHEDERRVAQSFRREIECLEFAFSLDTREFWPRYHNVLES